MFLFFHSFVNLFAGGRSDSKTILFFVYLLVLFIALRSKKKIGERISLWSGGITLGLLYIYGFISHILLSRIYDLPVTAFTITGNNGEISSITLFHIHEAKVVIGFLLSKFGVFTLKTIDAGGAYLGLLPPWWGAIGAILLCVCLIFSILCLYKVIARYGSKQKVWLLVVWYATISFSLIKTALDGGLLTPSIVSILVSFYLLERLKQQQENRAVLLGIYGASILSVILILVFPNWSFGIVIMQAIATLLLLVLLLLSFYCAPKKIYGMLCAVLFALSWYMASARDQEIWRYGNTPVETGSAYMFYNGLEVKKITSPVDTTIKVLTDSYNKNLSYAPISVPGKTCAENTPTQMVKVLVKTKKPLTSITEPYIVLGIKDQFFDGIWWHNNTVIQMSSCLPEPLSVLDGLLRKHGFDLYVMVNPLFYDESVAQ